MTKPEETVSAAKENSKHQGSNELAKEENSPVVKEGKTCLVAPPEHPNVCKAKDGNGKANGTDGEVGLARRSSSNCKVKRTDSKTKQKKPADAPKPKNRDPEAPGKTSKKASKEHGKGKSKPKDHVKSRKGSKTTVRSKKDRNGSAPPVVFNIENLTIIGQTETTQERGVRIMQELPGKVNAPATSGLQPAEWNTKPEQGGKAGSKFPGQ